MIKIKKMEIKTSVDFANFNYAYGDFQQQYRLKCENISSLDSSRFKKVKDNPLKIASSMIYEYLIFVKEENTKRYIMNQIKELEEEIEQDLEYTKLIEDKNKTAKKKAIYDKKYFEYLIKLYKIIGNYGDELTTTFMPNKRDRQKIVKYINTNSFFEHFTRYKSETSKRIADLNVLEFKQNFSYIIGFYFAYYLFVDNLTRRECENIIESIIDLYTDETVVKICLENTNKLSNAEKENLKKVDKVLHKAVVKIFLKINISYSNYGVIPKIEEKIDFDDTLI